MISSLVTDNGREFWRNQLWHEGLLKSMVVTSKVKDRTI